MKRIGLFSVVITLMALAASSCQTKKQPLEAKRTIICGEVVNTDENSATTIRVNLCDPLDESASPTIRLKETGGKLLQEVAEHPSSFDALKAQIDKLL